MLDKKVAQLLNDQVNKELYFCLKVLVYITRI